MSSSACSDIRVIRASAAILRSQIRRNFSPIGSTNLTSYTLNFPRAEILEPPGNAYSLMGVPMLVPGLTPLRLRPNGKSIRAFFF
jgi:hypothetical protein